MPETEQGSGNEGPADGQIPPSTPCSTGRVRDSNGNPIINGIIGVDGRCYAGPTATVDVYAGNCGVTSRYAHLSGIGAGIEYGKTGFGIIGVSGQSGNAAGQPATEAHLHLK